MTKKWGGFLSYLTSLLQTYYHWKIQVECGPRSRWGKQGWTRRKIFNSGNRIKFSLPLLLLIAVPVLQIMKTTSSLRIGIISCPTMYSQCPKIWHTVNICVEWINKCNCSECCNSSPRIPHTWGLIFLAEGSTTGRQPSAVSPLRELLQLKRVILA